LQKVAIVTLKKKVLLVAPLFDLGIDFGAFGTKIWAFNARVLV